MKLLERNPRRWIYGRGTNTGGRDRISAEVCVWGQNLNLHIEFIGDGWIPGSLTTVSGYGRFLRERYRGIHNGPLNLYRNFLLLHS